MQGLMRLHAQHAAKQAKCKILRNFLSHNNPECEHASLRNLVPSVLIFVLVLMSHQTLFNNVGKYFFQNLLPRAMQPTPADDVFLYGDKLLILFVRKYDASFRHETTFLVINYFFFFFSRCVVAPYIQVV